LDRILPLAFTGTRLRGGQLDLARARGFADLDREQLTRSLIAVLRRQPDTVAWARAELERLRSRAAEALAFELASRIQDEIQALDWVTCPQRVTTMEAGDF
jgi:excinuclease ABC subunit C